MKQNMEKTRRHLQYIKSAFSLNNEIEQKAPLGRLGIPLCQQMFVK